MAITDTDLLRARVCESVCIAVSFFLCWFDGDCASLDVGVHWPPRRIQITQVAYHSTSEGTPQAFSAGNICS